MNNEKPFNGIEHNNLWKFVSKCCGAGLSVEPLCRVSCGCCGKTAYPAKNWVKVK